VGFDVLDGNRMLTHDRSPTETQLQNDSGANIERLVTVATMSHKYSLSSFETWALSIVWIHCQSERDYLIDCPQNMLDGIYEAGAAGGRQDLCSLIEEKWLARLKRGELQLRHALDFGEAHDMRAFLADAYYQQARDMKSFAPKLGSGSAVVDFSQLNLTDSQIRRLLSGYCSLSLFWESFKNTTLSPACPQNHWRHPTTMDEIVDKDHHDNDPLNVLEWLNCARANARNDYCECRRTYVDTLISDFSGANHFL
jgi:hypothetical protein